MADPIPTQRPTAARVVCEPGAEARLQEACARLRPASPAEAAADLLPLLIECAGALRGSVSRQRALDWLVEGLRELLQYATERGVTIGFEPEPGMLIDCMTGYEELLGRVDAANFRLTLDVGHLHCQGEVPIEDYIRRWAPRLVNVHLEDMRRGVHEHLMFGEGQIDFPPVLRALAEAGYPGGVHVELSRHSHEAPQAARRAFELLSPIIERL